MKTDTSSNRTISVPATATGLPDTAGSPWWLALSIAASLWFIGAVVLAMQTSWIGWAGWALIGGAWMTWSKRDGWPQWVTAIGWTLGCTFVASTWANTWWIAAAWGLLAAAPAWLAVWLLAAKEWNWATWLLPISALLALAWTSTNWSSWSWTASHTHNSSAQTDEDCFVDATVGKIRLSHTSINIEERENCPRRPYSVGGDRW